MKEMLGALAVVLAFAVFAPYILDIFRGTTKPHVYTYIIWTLVAGLVFLGQYTSGAGPGAWTTGAMMILSAYVLFLSLTYGTDDVTRSDLLLLVVALLSIIPWFVTKDPTLSVVLESLIEVCAFVPTIRKTFNEPGSESLLSWIFNLARSIVALFALVTVSLVTYIYPVVLVFMSAVMILIIVVRKKHFVNHGIIKI